ncbi:phage scaffolding protein [Streptococcus suis]|uniref:phage scaffolding protein n=1 Tax=Streptococcus suis TaxID=1307 RepID=UPI001581784F|nr:phage scaffolding protein [Streptococcus suis]MCG9862656.1 phage scaffolding protein [Streptococcus suis]MCG9883897.1 phage scaffolding protein [Streptococcus suis]HEM6498922.1 phage scaffolding protein [Streptococcus suis]
MEWLKELIKKHTSDGKTDIDAVMNDVNAEFPKHAVTKSVYNEQAEKLKTANATLDTLKKNNKDNEELQAELKNYKDQVKKLEQEAADTAHKQSIKDALVKAGATDVDYLMYKLGDVEAGELENKIKNLQTEHASFFKSETSDNTPDGFKKLGGVDLPDGKSAKLYSREAIAQMRPEEINANWDAIKQSLENGD